MKKDEARLGKGLGAIFGDDLSNVIEEIQQGDESRQSEIKLSEIRPNPYQPRKIFDDEKIGELAQSIKEHGVFTPVLLRKSVKGYELIAGERRVRASKKAGLKTIPAIVMEFTEEQMMEISLLENIQREDLNAIEEAQAYQRLIERLDYTQEKLAQRVGKSREHITNTLRLLKLPKSVQHLVTENKLSMGHVRPSGVTSRFSHGLHECGEQAATAPPACPLARPLRCQPIAPLCPRSTPARLLRLLAAITCFLVYQ